MDFDINDKLLDDIKSIVKYQNKLLISAIAEGEKWNIEAIRDLID